MKRKFAFGLAPVKTASQKTENASNPAPPIPRPSTQALRTHQSEDSLPSPDSPFISRQTLPPETERELRAACALILQNFKPSDHGLIDTDPKLDFKGLNRRREGKADTEPVLVRRPTGAPADASSVRDHAKRSRQTDNPATVRGDKPERANTGRRRTEHADAAAPSQLTVANAGTDVDDRSLGTPRTVSTDAHLQEASTAQTSVREASGSSSNRVSHKVEQKTSDSKKRASAMDPEAHGKEQAGSHPQPALDPKPQPRPPSRGRSIRDIKGYIFSKSGNLARRESHESLDQRNARPSLQIDTSRNSSSHGWRSWGLQRKPSSRSTSRPVSSRGRSMDEDPARRNEVNLNRELPPLPSLDTWKDQEKLAAKEKRQSHMGSAHIATVMRPPNQQQEYAAAVRAHHRRSGSDSLALKVKAAALLHPSAPSAVASTKSSPHRSSNKDRPVNFDELLTALDSSNKDASDQSRPGPKMSQDRSRSAAPNFSRKISTDITSPRRQDESYTKFVQISSPPELRQENTSRLKKALSGWMLRKEKKDTWMDRFEKKGIKNGVMIQDEAALSPVVRY
ncbi:hypothetical protein M011DRAFT_483456 [Sporormia fimetaria CBS 119925]|uniref:Uncharacterized protein n=1 Tax=Sporormia fimetaria CBS 119925 TaxID=1340428 RepID=A0A6A6VM06_9PLEO|nr:hypothetical protein M011DRAFT_483456 [Sporormia fimetaria CBS 119925]